MKTTKFDLDQEMSYLLCSAFEGGSNYWYRIEDYVYPAGFTEKDFEFPYLELPFKGGKIKITADGGRKIYILDREALDKGWLVFRGDYARHYADAMTGSADATTGDVFLQCCLFGKIIFG